MKLRAVVRWGSRAVLALVLLAFPFGPLFPWSPLKPGYRSVVSNRAEAWYPRDAATPASFAHLDEDIAGVEAFLNLRVPKRITFIVARDWSDFRRFVPQMALSRGIGAVTLPTGTVIVVSPRVNERGFDLGEFLRHEITHAAMHQNQSLWQAMMSPRREPWFCEGLSVSYGRQKAFLTRDQFLEKVRGGEDLRRAIDRTADAPGHDIRFDYLAWRYFNEYLRERHGEARFHEFLLAFLGDHAASRAAFARVYSMRFEDAIAEYQGNLRAGAWSPR